MSTAGNSQIAKSIKIVTEQRRAFGPAATASPRAGSLVPTTWMGSLSYHGLRTAESGQNTRQAVREQ